MEYVTIIQLAIQIVYWIVVFICVLAILRQRLDPARSLSWIVVVILIPIAGIVLYIFLGQNFRRKWIHARRENRELEFIEKYYKKQLDEIHRLEKNTGNNKKLITLLLNNSRSLITTGNTVEIFWDGKSTMEAILDGIRNAKESIHLEYYILEPDNVGMTLIDLLCEKAKSGVKVRILYDGVGSWGLKRKIIRKIKRSGIEISCFFPIVFPLLSSRLNNRNHRKIVVIDGTIGFTGGINIAERYLSDSWHDAHLRIQGDAVKVLQLTFLRDWHYATKEIVKDWKSYFKSKETTIGSTNVQIAVSGPDMQWASIMQAYFEAISKARESIYISTPYFMPTQPILTALKIAALSGIDVRLMMPKECDVKLAKWATRSYFSELIDAGVGIYLFKDGFIHAKMLCVDNDICSIGSVNMDERSFEDNYEVTAFMYNQDIVSQVKTKFIEGCNRCHKLTESRRSSHALIEAVCRLLSPIL